MFGFAYPGQTYPAGYPFVDTGFVPPILTEAADPITGSRWNAIIGVAWESITGTSWRSVDRGRR